jgi:general secretion pathway protein F
MAKFKYRAYTNEGDLVEGEIETSDISEVSSILLERQIVPYEIQNTNKSLFNFNLKFNKKTNSLSEQEIAEFTREIATLLEANIPVDQCLKIISSQTTRKKYNNLAEEILANLEEGSSLSDSFYNYGDVFNREYINIIRVGEKVGKVDLSLKDLADMLERRMEIKKRLQSALIYPSLLIIMALISTAVIIGTLVPNIAPIFKENGQPIPSGLQFIIDIVDAWQIIFGVIIVLVVIFFVLTKLSKDRRDWLISFDKMTLNIPVAGNLISENTLARFSRTVGSMLKSGVPLIQCLESGHIAIQNNYFKTRFEDLTKQVTSGARLSHSMKDVEFIPSMVMQMVSIGEETGRLDEMFLRIANILEKKTQTTIERMMGLLTPILTIMIAAVVGGLIITVMNAVLSINDLAGR